MAEEKKAKVGEDEALKEGKKLDVSGAQVAGGALASVTAAFLGSKLGVLGTLWGAGLTSVVITVGGALYQRSLENTREKANIAAAKAALKRATKLTPTGPGQSEEQEAARPADPDRTRRLSSVTPSDLQWPGGERVEDPEGTRQIGTPRNGEGGTSALSDAATTRVVQVSPPAPRKRIKWAMVAVTSAVIFGLGMLVVTGFEGLTGKPLSGEQKGTTLGQVFKAPGPSPEDPVEPPAPAPTRAPEPSSGAQPERDAESSVEQPPEPSASMPAPEPTSPGEPAPTSPAPTAEVPTGQETTVPQYPVESGQSGEDAVPTEQKWE